jgi:asparagine synthase (glutamine-hydrolysing)
VAAVAAPIHLKKFGRRLRTFSIGLEGSSDEAYAKMVAKYIDSEHVHIKSTVEEFLSVLPEIIKTIETIDITSIRASTPQFLISRWIYRNTDIKVVFVGDGADEVENGYLYVHKAPNLEALLADNLRLLRDIHLFDGLRADRCIAGNGLEARFPYLNHEFVEAYLSVAMELRKPIDGLEKWLMRESFRESKVLPEEVLFRRKCAFSDAVSSQDMSWYQVIKNHVDKLYTDEELLQKQKLYAYLPPRTKEALFDREQFEKHYGPQAALVTPYFWMPKWVGDDVTDPSARTLSFYAEGTHKSSNQQLQQKQ